MAQAIVRLRATMWGELLAEFLGTFVLIAWGWALAVAFGVYVAGGVSGAHINPAVTLALAVKRNFPWVKVAPTWRPRCWGRSSGARSSTSSTTTPSPASRWPSTSPVGRSAGRPTRRPSHLRPVRGRRPTGTQGTAGPRRRGLRRDGRGAADDGRREGRGPGPHRPGALGGRQPGYSARLGRTTTRRPPQCGQRVDPGAVAEAPSRK